MQIVSMHSYHFLHTYYTLYSKYLINTRHIYTIYSLWLNEGFAAFMEHFAIDALYPEYKIWEQYTTDSFGMCSIWHVCVFMSYECVWLCSILLLSI